MKCFDINVHYRLVIMLAVITLQSRDPLWMSSTETYLSSGTHPSGGGHLTLGRKALIIRYMLRTLRFIEKSQSLSPQSRMVP